MKLYFASVENNLAANEQGVALTRDFQALNVNYGLTSYFYIKDEPEPLERLRYIPHLFLDSGAFSAHKSKGKIVLMDYMEFVKKHEKHLDLYANLDVIGDAQKTLDNQFEMEKQGLKPLPTFHYGENWDYLKDYINMGYKYIAFGGLVGKNQRARLLFLKQAFSMIPKNVKVHGFGMTSPRLLKLFPWHSADSINWLMGAIRGVIYQYDKGNIYPAKINKKPRQGEMQHLKREFTRIGNVQPILVRPLGGGSQYQILDGEHRWKVAKHFQHETIKAIILQLNDEQAKLTTINMNRIHGADDPLKLAYLLQDLKKTIDIKELAILTNIKLPELQATIDLQSLPDLNPLDLIEADRFVICPHCSKEIDIDKVKIRRREHGRNTKSTGATTGERAGSSQ